jgi:hypothetical protein
MSIYAWTFPVLNGDFMSIHAWTIPVLNGDFMCILNGNEWTLEWDLLVAEWQKMAHRPFTSSIQRRRSSHTLFVSTEWR